MKRGEMHDCRNCGGDGYTIDAPECPACKGEGRVPYTPLPRVSAADRLAAERVEFATFMLTRGRPGR